MPKPTLPDWAKVGGEVIVVRVVGIGQWRGERATLERIGAISAAGILQIGERAECFKVSEGGESARTYPPSSRYNKRAYPVTGPNLRAFADALRAEETAIAEEAERKRRQEQAERARADRQSKRERALRSLLERKDLKPLEREALKRALQTVDGLELGDF